MLVTPAPQADAYFAPLGTFPKESLQALATFYKDTYDLTITILPAAPIVAAARDAKRNQVVAEAVLGSLLAAYPMIAADPKIVIIAFVTDNLYILSRTDWAWAFGLRQRPFGVVSTFHMRATGNESASLPMTRLRKMVTRDLGVLYFGLRLNQDPDSILFADIGGVEDLDRVSEELPELVLPSPGST